MKRRYLLATCFYLSFYANLTLRAGASPTSVCDESGLRAALAIGGVINFGCDGTIVLSSTLTITTNTVLDASGHNVVVSGGDSVRIFRLATNVDFTIRGLTIANGNVTGKNGSLGETALGAGILNDGGRLILMNCSLSSNVCLGGAGLAVSGEGRRGAGAGLGAAIYNNGGSLTVSNCVLVANLCRGGQGSGYTSSAGNSIEGAGGVAAGAAIYAKNSIVIINSSEIRSNRVVGGPPVSGLVETLRIGGAGSGGGVFLENGTVSIAQTLFSDNKANGGAATGSPVVNYSSPSGAGQGGAAFITNSAVSISSCRFEGNGAAAGVDYGRNSQSGLTYGGAIFNAGTLYVSDTLFNGNTGVGGAAANGGGEADGGAVYNVTSMALNRTTFAGNQTQGGAGGTTSVPHDGGAAKGGAVFNRGDLSVTNTTFYSNQALGGAPPSSSFPIHAGDGVGGGIFNQGNAILVNATVAQNNVGSPATGGFMQPQPGLVAGGGIFTTNGSFIAQNTLIANNLSGSNCFGVLIDNGNNLSSDSSCRFTSPGSFNNTDPLLSSLDDYGGLTPTMALLAGSPAIDHGLALYCPATDQRGVPRPVGNGCDIGAFEFKISPYPENALTIESYSNQVLHLVFTGTKGKAYQVQTATNFTNWTSLGTNTVRTNGIFDFFFTNILSEPTRFFRTQTP